MNREWTLAVLLCCATGCARAEERRVLIFSKTAGYRHASIPDGIAALSALARKAGMAADASEDGAMFDDPTLRQYVAVVFLSTTGTVLDAGQQAAFERYIRGGGGFLGIHAAADSGYSWPFYGSLVGAYFKDHPPIQPAWLVVGDATQASTAGLPQRWQRIDEWYNFQSNPRSAVHVLVTLDESTMSGGEMGADHPMAWCHGRSFYTALGHTTESYSEPLFLSHLKGGLLTAAGLAACPSQ